MTTPKPGDFFTYHDSTTRWKDQLVAFIVQFGTASQVNHAGIYVGLIEGVPTVVEARPGGAGYAPLSQYLNSWTHWSGGAGIPTGNLERMWRRDIVHAAISLVGTPYGWLDLVAVALAQKRLGAHLDRVSPLDKQPWWVKRIARQDRLICSELVDVAYLQAGVYLFNDGRYPGCVSPADLDGLIG